MALRSLQLTLRSLQLALKYPSGWPSEPSSGPQIPLTSLWMDKRTDGRTEFLPILQDFVPSRGRCPATFCNLKTAKKQGKGTVDHVMPIGDWFIPSPAAGHSDQLSL